MWDSGNQTSSKAYLIPYEGTALTSDTLYVWNVVSVSTNGELHGEHRRDQEREEQGVHARLLALIDRERVHRHEQRGREAEWRTAQAQAEATSDQATRASCSNGSTWL